MKPEETKAHAAKLKPPKLVRDAMAECKRVSKSSRSTARTDLEFDDGSGLIVTSTDGAEAELELVTPPPSPANPEELAR